MRRVAFWKAIVGLTLLAIAGITFETAATGFERAYTVRAADVETRSTSLPRPTDESAISKIRPRLSSKSRAELVAQLAGIDAQELGEIEQHTERCKAVGTACNSKPYIDEIRLAAEAKRAPLRAELAAIDNELSGNSRSTSVA